MDSFSDTSPTTTINPRDMQTSYAPLSPPGTSASSSQGDDHDHDPHTSTSSSSRKKRKSWGQQLPKPTTNLPPRKRAKTDAEKQQRLYERVQRNRQAAHNSRMRKQDEMDRHVAENNALKQDNQHLTHEVQRLKEELARLRQSSNPSKFDFNTSSPPSMHFSSLHSRQSTPSLSNGSSLDASIEEPEATMPSQHFYQPPADLDIKPFNDTRSAAMCSQQWTLNARHVSPGPTFSPPLPLTT